MKQKAFISCVLFISFLFVAFTAKSNDEKKTFKYIGVNSCAKMCHKSEKQGSQLSIWEASSHSKAYKTLLTAEADKICKELGKGEKAAESDFCLKCHVTGHGEAPALFEEKFSKEDGVQCEACHGPGSEYKSMKIMKDKQEAIKNGLNIPTNPADYCIKCHNSESPTYKDFKFEEKWAKIKHYIPKDK